MKFRALGQTLRLLRKRTSLNSCISSGLTYIQSKVPGYALCVCTIIGDLKKEPKSSEFFHVLFRLLVSLKVLRLQPSGDSWGGNYPRID